MKIYIGIKNGNLLPQAFTSLTGICNELGVNYDSAMRNGKRLWVKKENILEIKEVEIVKIKNRGNFN